MIPAEASQPVTSNSQQRKKKYAATAATNSRMAISQAGCVRVVMAPKRPSMSASHCVTKPETLNVVLVQMRMAQELRMPCRTNATCGDGSFSLTVK